MIWSLRLIISAFNNTLRLIFSHIFYETSFLFGKMDVDSSLEVWAYDCFLMDWGGIERAANFDAVFVGLYS